MKRAFYIVFLLGVLLSMQSCDRIGNLIGESDTPKEQPAEVQAQESVDNASTDTLGTTKIQTQLLQNEDGIRALKDSLTSLNGKISSLQAAVDSLQQQQAELAQTKVGAKSLFVYVAIFAIFIVVLVLFLTKKKRGQDNLTEKQVKDIIADFAKDHPNLICRETLSQLNSQKGLISNHKQALDSINTRLNNLETRIGSTVPTFNTQGTQTSSSEKSVAGGAQAGGTSNVFYMKRPQKDMEFDLSLRSERQTEETLYRFEIDRRNPNVAHFFFDCMYPNRVRWALSTRENTLDRVCNASGSDANGTYRCTAPGEAKLQDGKWVVTRKAVVIFD